MTWVNFLKTYVPNTAHTQIFPKNICAHELVFPKMSVRMAYFPQKCLCTWAYFPKNVYANGQIFPKMFVRMCQFSQKSLCACAKFSQ